MPVMSAAREQLVERALCRGASLTLENPAYRQAVAAFTDTLLAADLAPKDLTVTALGFKGRHSSAAVIANEGGVAAGLAELAFLLESRGVGVHLEKMDGDVLRPGEILLRAEGDDMLLLSLERVGLNLVQRMCGIATTARCVQERARKQAPHVRVVGTRKTPWGLLDKRALHLGCGGTHRLGLGDAIVIKNNHLALVAAREDEAAPIAIERAWKFRKEAAFIEVEVRGEVAARVAAGAFRRLLDQAPEAYPCLLMLDNMAPDELRAIVEMLRREGLWDYALVEASGGISEKNIEAYAASGVDAVSIGALTHSARALDLRQGIS